MKKIRIAQIGTSQYSHGNGILRTLKRLPEEFEVVGYALCEGEREKFPDFMGEFDGLKELSPEQILSDPTIDAVAVETEEIYLTKYALMVAEAGKHIHMEKPGSQELAAFEQLIRKVQEKKLTLHLGYMYRYNPLVQELLEEIRRGDLGEILNVQAQMSGDQPADLRQWLSLFRGGMMFYLGCHIIDLVYRIQGEPLAVFPHNCATGLEGAEGEDFSLALLQYEKGISTVRSDANQLGGYPLRSLVVTGTKKTVCLNPIEMVYPGGQITTRLDLSSRDWFDRGSQRDSAPYHRYKGMMRGFAAMVRGETANPYTPEYELALFRLILKCCGIEN